MSLLTELFGEEILTATLTEVKVKIRTLPTTSRRKKAYLLQDYARATGVAVTQEDFDDVGVGQFR